MDKFTLRSGENLLTVAATDNGLFALEAGQWVKKHDGAAVTMGRELCSYGNSIYALFGIRLLKADLDGGTLSTFGEVETAPNAEVMGVVRDFLVLGRLSEHPSGIHWSAIDAPTSWPAIGSDEAQFVQSDRQIFPVGGCVQAIVGGVGGVDGLVFLEDAIQRMTYVGTPYIFQFAPVDRDRGLLAPHSPVVAGALCFYLSEDGWKMTDGASVRPIGNGRVGGTIFGGDKRAIPRRVGLNCKTQFYNWLYKSARRTL